MNKKLKSLNSSIHINPTSITDNVTISNPFESANAFDNCLLELL